MAQGGFTLLELLVVIAIIALATAGVGLALRDSGAAALQREGERLTVKIAAGVMGSIGDLPMGPFELMDTVGIDVILDVRDPSSWNRFHLEDARSTTLEVPPRSHSTWATRALTAQRAR